MGPVKLVCGACGRTETFGPGATVCPECGKPLLARYATGALEGTALRRAWSERRGAGMWRFRELLPLRDGEEPVTLGEGDTPLVRAEELGSELDLHLFVKDESRNPTGSFKDRGLSAAVTRAALDGAKSFVVPSAGNAAAALSAFAARAGLPAKVYLPADTPEGVRRRCRHYGAEVEEVNGLITDCGREAAAYARETGAFSVSTLHEPYRLEGKKTMMLEVVDALGWRAPDAIVYPTGGGTGLIGSWKVLGELVEAGVLESAPTRMYAVQSEGCAPVVRAWEEGRTEATEWRDASTEAFGLRVPRALGDFLILRALRETEGGAIAVPDRAMRRAAADLGRREGIDAAIEGGATLAAARALREAGELAPGETVVLFNTGSQLAY
jgi:threonine synthase